MPDRNELTQSLEYVLRNDFWSFCSYYDPEFFTEAKTHLIRIASVLQGVTDGRIRKLMISMPPRAGKSYTVTLWCAWMIGRGAEDPDTSIMRNSYGQDLAEKFSYDIREIVQNPKYLDVFPLVALKTDHSRINDWAIKGAKQSTYFCAGVGGAITGKGCRTVAILDDPIKNLEDSLSETLLEKTWSWYLSTHKSRMETSCPEIHIATRWSVNDPIGRLLVSEESGLWTTVVIPAMDEQGRSFCEAVKTTAEYQEMKKILDPYIWDAEFMQRPVEAKGLLFPVSSLKRFKMKDLAADRVSGRLGYTDTADEGDDYLCSIAGAVSGEKCFITDIVFTQDPIEVTEPLVAAQIINTNQNRHTIESNNGGKGFALNIRNLIRGKSHCVVSWRATTTNKETRILMNSGQIKEFFYFRDDYEPGSDYDRFMRQLTSYVKMGKNKHDDAPDAITGLAEMIFKRNSVGFLSAD